MAGGQAEDRRRVGAREQAGNRVRRPCRRDVGRLFTGPSGTRSSPAATASVGPTTVRQLCNSQPWPRPIPDVVGRLLYQAKDGSLGCWDNIRAVAPDGHDPLAEPARAGERSYRIVAVSPAVGSPASHHDVVTIELGEVDPKAPPAFRPCDWVTTVEAAGILGAPVRAQPLGADAGSVDIACLYEAAGDEAGGVDVGLQLPGAFPVDAAAEFALATSRMTAVNGLGVRAGCVDETTTSPPATVLLVLLDGGRLLRLVQGEGSCAILQRFARLAIGRVGG